MAGEVLYPHVSVRLTGTDGNVFALMARVMEALGHSGVSPQEISTFEKRIFDCGSYDEALAVMMQTVSVS